MALDKKIQTNFGVDATYWKVVEVNINWHANCVHITMLGWVDRIARDSGKQPIDQRTFDWNGEDFPFVDKEPQNERAQAYGKIKSLKVIQPDPTDLGKSVLTDGEFVGEKDI